MHTQFTKDTNVICCYKKTRTHARHTTQAKEEAWLSWGLCYHHNDSGAGYRKAHIACIGGRKQEKRNRRAETKENYFQGIKKKRELKSSGSTQPVFCQKGKSHQWRRGKLLASRMIMISLKGGKKVKDTAWLGKGNQNKVELWRREKQLGKEIGVSNSGSVPLNSWRR